MREADETPFTERKVVRRGLIAGLAGLGAAALMKLAGAEKAEAVDGDPVKLGFENPAGGATVVRNDHVILPALVGISHPSSSWVVAPDGAQGVTNKAGAFGVRGRNLAGGVSAGVAGETSDAAGVGVIGVAGLLGSIPRGSVGVEGLSQASNGIGVGGLNANNGTGVYGISNASDFVATGNGSGQGVHGKSGTGIGVLGEATNAGGAGSGVRGNAAGSGNGVHGVSNSGAGLRGNSTSFVGIVGISVSNHGLYGSTNGVNAYGIVAENLGGGPGLFVQGNSVINGSLQVIGAKNAIIKMADGSDAAVYCQESPEPYFEDFGRAQLIGGVANVPLEREFATLVAGGNYHVFTEPEGETRGLFVSRRTPTGFEVREIGGGTGSVPFSYRIVTRRKDIEGRRFARVDLTAMRQLAVTRAALGVNGGGVPNPPPAPQPFVPPVAPPAQPGPVVQPGPGLTVQQPPTDGGAGR